MPIVIGARPESTFADPMGLLTDCHRRVERFLSVLVEISAASEPLSDGRRTALETALRYFREAAPKHTADEEQSLFPRLRSSDRPEAKAVLAKVDSIEQDHVQAQRMHAEVDELGREWLASGALPPAGARRLSFLTSELAKLYQEHIALEELELFPVAAASLDPEQREAMGREMAARRGAEYRPASG